MNGSVVKKGFLVMAAALAVVSFAGGGMYLSGQFTVDVGGTAMRIGVGSVLVLSGLALVAGLWASPHGVCDCRQGVRRRELHPDNPG